MKIDRIDRKILKIISKKDLTLEEIGERIGISKQAVHKRLQKMIYYGLLQKIGRTKGTRYVLTREGMNIVGKNLETSKNFIETPKPVKIKITFNPQISEDEAFEKIDRSLGLRRFLNTNAFDVAKYVFTEIFNNALEHSASEKIETVIELKPDALSISIKDYGKGIFKVISENLGLKSEHDAILWLIPGKTTTLPERHTGEGIFFSSKAARSLAIKSHRLCLRFVNYSKDVHVEKMKGYLKGTLVEFEIPYNLKRKLTKIFESYAPIKYDYRFEISRVIVKILGGKLISRSQAKRLVEPIRGKFREIIFDFTKVEAVGQGFLDELLRVFPANEPEIKIWVKNIPNEFKPLFFHVQVDKNRIKIG